jgi:hypothetical protein
MAIAEIVYSNNNPKKCINPPREEEVFMPSG